MLPEFKAWNKRDKRFVDLKKEEYVYDLASGLIISLSEDLKLKEEADYIELLQYTGHRDIKTGEKIFEGHIVKTKYGENGEHIGVVQSAVKQFESHGIHESFLEHEKMNDLFEIIGNKFEHAHLLEDDSSERETNYLKKHKRNEEHILKSIQELERK